MHSAIPASRLSQSLTFSSILFVAALLSPATGQAAVIQAVFGGTIKTYSATLATKDAVLGLDTTISFGPDLTGAAARFIYTYDPEVSPVPAFSFVSDATSWSDDVLNNPFLQNVSHSGGIVASHVTQPSGVASSFSAYSSGSSFNGAYDFYSNTTAFVFQRGEPLAIPLAKDQTFSLILSDFDKDAIESYASFSRKTVVKAGGDQLDPTFTQTTTVAMTLSLDWLVVGDPATVAAFVPPAQPPAPVPLPAAGGLLVAALAGLGLLRHRRVFSA